MGLFKRLAGLLGLAKDEDQQHRDGDAAAETAAPPPFSIPSAAAATAPAQHIPRRGFSVPVHVPVERGPPAPLLVFCPSGDGGVQVCSARDHFHVFVLLFAECTLRHR